MKKQQYNESDLYPPIKKYFSELGYGVNGEVKNCDVVLAKDGELAIIELKTSFNMPLLYQAIDRMKITSQVYVAIPRLKKHNGAQMRNIAHIAKKLGLGLITVAMDSEFRHVEIIAFPDGSSGASGSSGSSASSGEKKLSGKNARRRASIIKEASQRSMDLNRGGISRRKLATAYREKAIKIACALEKNGAMKPSEMIRSCNCDADAQSIVYKNHYGWFEKLGKGNYRLAGEGKKMLDGALFAEIIEHYRKTFNP